MLWFEIDNPVLNGMKPKDYHQNGNWDLLLNKIENAIKEAKNERSE